MSTSIRILALTAVTLATTLLELPQSGAAQPSRQSPRLADPHIQQWVPFLPAVQKLFKEQGVQCRESLSPASLTAAADFASLNLSIALVDCGGMGAYTDSIVPVQRLGHVLSLVHVRHSGVKGDFPGFIQGASVMHSVSINLDPDQIAIRETHCDTDSKAQLQDCSVLVYVWNPHAATFDWNRTASKQATRNLEVNRGPASTR